MIAIDPPLAAELDELRGAALVGLGELAEETGVDSLAPPAPSTLSDLALNFARAVDEAVAEVVEMAEACGRGHARRRARILARRLAGELQAEMELEALHR